MPRELDRDAFGTIELDEDRGILELVWLEESARMTDDDFMRSMGRFADLAVERRPAHLLVDVREFRHSPGPSVARWRDEYVIPRYNEAGVSGFAFLLPAGAEESPPAVEPPGRFPTGYFTERGRILAWFAESPA